jgi:hypothetical protein
MKNLVCCIVSALLLSCAVHGQKNPQPQVSVIWSADANCHAGNTPEVKAMRPECSLVELDTVTFAIVNYGGVSYAMSHRPVRNYLVASVQISNRSDTPIQASPLRSKIVRFKDVAAFAANTKGESSNAQSQDDLRRASYREATVTAESDGGIRSGLRVQERYEDTRNRSQRVVSRATVNEPAAPPSSDPTPSAITNQVLIPRAVFDNVMKSKSIASGEKAAGHIVFKAPEKDGYIVFYLNAGPIEFVFPVDVKPGS